MKENRTLEEMKKDIEIMNAKVQIAEVAQVLVKKIERDYYQSKRDENDEIIFDEDCNPIPDYNKPSTTWWMNTTLDNEEVARLASELQQRLESELMKWVRG